MIEIEIPGYRTLRLAHVVLDYNGTLAIDGELIAGAGPRLEALAGELEIHVITADTFGKVAEGMRGMPCRVTVLPPGDQTAAKQRYVEELGAESVVAVGNGRNDGLMLKAAGLGIVLVQMEGAAVESLLAADVVCASVNDALDLLAHPLRLRASLRS